METVDLDGNPRFNANELDFDRGCGIPVVVDMGAYEYQFDPVEDVIFADLNGDGAVGILDLLGVLAAWDGAGNNCLADLDIDGAVGILDLLPSVAAWGDCPVKGECSAGRHGAGKPSTAPISACVQIRRGRLQ